MNLSDLTPQAMLDRLAEMSAHQPEIETLIYILGRERILEWVHSCGVSMDNRLRELAPPVPPIELRSIVAATSEPVFLWSGLKDAETCATYLDRHVQRDASLPVHILDFGCGCGRVTRFLQAIERFQVSGTDVNNRLVTWCQQHLKAVATVVNYVSPPLEFDRAQFDFVFSLSIFTHLHETSMFAWLDELASVTADNGIVLLTTHGYHAIDIICESELHQGMFQMSRAEAEELRTTFEQRQCVFRQYSSDVIKVADAGADYGNTFIHERFIRERWTGDTFDVVEFVPGGLRGWQDITVLRRRARPGAAAARHATTPIAATSASLNVNRTISPNDAMFAGNAEHYFACGESALRVLLEAIESSGAATPTRILDFGAGAGRVTRWLRAAFPASSISACDLREADMVFLRNLCGADTWTVGTDVEALTIPGRYDLIWAGSVITHLSESKTQTLIRRLLSVCNPRGLLVLSFHGQFAIERQESTAFKYIDDDGWQEIKRGYVARGYGYADYKPEWAPGMVGQDSYGISVNTPDWMSTTVRELPECRLVLLKARVWDGHHDVVAIQRMM